MTDFEKECREFAKQFPTSNVRQAIRHAESGDISWYNLYELFRRSLGKALNESGDSK